MGSTFVHEPDSRKLAALASDLDSIDDSPHVDLVVLQTLDFEVPCSPRKVTWSNGEPVHYDADAGLAVFPISADGLDFVLRGAHQLTEDQAADVAKL